MLATAVLLARRAGCDDKRGLGTMRRFILAAMLALAFAGCTPKVAVEAPKEPITINLNIKLDADVRLRVEEKAKSDVEKNPIF
jgi:YnbE-like lipoprotein